MAVGKRTLQELSRLGTEAYESKVRPKLRSEHHGEYVAVDVDTGEFEIDANDLNAIHRLKARMPNAEIWLMQAGCATSCRTGLRRVPTL
jgi:hypothetical protein